MNGERDAMQCPLAEPVDHGSVEGQNEFVEVEGATLRLGYNSGLSIEIPLGNSTPMSAKYPWSGGRARTPGAFTLSFIHSSQWDTYINNPSLLDANPTLAYHEPPPNRENKVNIIPNYDEDGNPNPGVVTIRVLKLAHYNSNAELLLNGVPWQGRHDWKENKYSYQLTSPYIFDSGAAAIGEPGYGMNQRIYDLPNGMPRVMLLDYEKTVADLADSDTRLHEDSWTANQAPRHNGTANALLGDGSVFAYFPDDLNPNDPVIQATMWRPD